MAQWLELVLSILDQNPSSGGDKSWLEWRPFMLLVLEEDVANLLTVVRYAKRTRLC